MIEVKEPICQANPKWSGAILGDGVRTYGQAGCLLSCLVMGANVTAKNGLTLIEANAIVRHADGFAGSGLIFDKAAHALGCWVVYDGAYDSDRALDAITSGCPVIVGIDYKPGASSGLSDADHFLLVVGEYESGYWRAIDPATGNLASIPRLKPFTYRTGTATISEMRIIAALEKDEVPGA